MSEFAIKINFPECSPVLIYLPGIHGDLTLAQKIRHYFENKLCFVEIEYSKRTDLSMQDYANSIERLITNCGIEECWLLAESFGSQVAWAIVSEKRSFNVKGIILAGGFVRHPFIPGVRIVKAVSKLLPMWAIEVWLKLYIAICRLLFRKKKTEKSPLPEQFVKNRLEDADRGAIISRYEMILKNDYRPVARRVCFPVYFLAGRWDFIVPWISVLKWLKNNCPGFKDFKIIKYADHPVISVAPEESAKQILEWIRN